MLFSDPFHHQSVFTQRTATSSLMFFYLQCSFCRIGAPWCMKVLQFLRCWGTNECLLHVCLNNLYLHMTRCLHQQLGVSEEANTDIWMSRCSYILLFISKIAMSCSFWGVSRSGLCWLEWYLVLFVSCVLKCHKWVTHSCQTSRCAQQSFMTFYQRWAGLYFRDLK